MYDRPEKHFGLRLWRLPAVRDIAALTSQIMQIFNIVFKSKFSPGRIGQHENSGEEVVKAIKADFCWVTLYYCYHSVSVGITSTNNPSGKQTRLKGCRAFFAVRSLLRMENVNETAKEKIAKLLGGIYVFNAQSANLFFICLVAQEAESGNKFESQTITQAFPFIQTLLASCLIDLMEK